MNTSPPDSAEREVSVLNDPDNSDPDRVRDTDPTRDPSCLSTLKVNVIEPDPSDRSRVFILMPLASNVVASGGIVAIHSHVGVPLVLAGMVALIYCPSPWTWEYAADTDGGTGRDP